MMKLSAKQQAEYERDCENFRNAVLEWIERESQTRLVDLRWREWGTTVHIGTLEDRCLDVLCESDDAKALVRYADDHSGNRCTLLMAYVIVEMLGLKTKGKGSPPVLPKGVPIMMMKNERGPRGEPN